MLTTMKVSFTNHLLNFLGLWLNDQYELQLCRFLFGSMTMRKHPKGHDVLNILALFPCRPVPLLASDHDMQ